MSQPGPQYPYASPQTPPATYQAAAAFKPIDRIEYLRAYQFVFENPNWVMNIVWGFLCLISQMLVPVVGQLVLIGYQFEVIDGLLRTQGGRYPDFDVNRFADYLARSIWPFLVGLLLLIPAAMVLIAGALCVALVVAAGGAIGGDDFGPVLAIIAAIVGIAFLVPFWIAVIGLCLPLILRAGLMQDFGGAFDFPWAWDFLKKTWIELVLVFLFLMVTGSVLAIAGYLALCIGIFAVQALIQLAQTHFYYQLYMLYLSRGGTPVPVKVPLPQVVGKPV